MDTNTLFTVIGGIITIALTINAFFLKSILVSQNDMKVEIGKLLVKVENYSGRIEELEHKTRKLELEAVECRSSCHKG